MKVVQSEFRQETAPPVAQNTLQGMIDGFQKGGPSVAVLQFTRQGSDQYSYDKLLDQVRKLATGLSSLGIKKGDSVMLLAANSPEWVMSALAVVYSGGVIVPIDPQVNDETINHIITDSGAKVAFADNKSAQRLEKINRSKTLNVISFEQTAEPEAGNTNSNDNKSDEVTSKTETPTKGANEKEKSYRQEWTKLFAKSAKDPAAVAPDDIAILFYTSGTTGLPKGVPLTHTNILFQLAAIRKSKLLKPDDRFLQPLPMFHVYPFVIGLLVPLSLGLPVIFPRAMTGPEIAQALQQGRATVLISVPKLLRAIYSALESKVQAKGAFAESAFSAMLKMTGNLNKLCRIKVGKSVFKSVHTQFAPQLRLLACGGAALDPELCFNLNALGWDLAIGYGLTETSPLLCMRLPGNPDLQSVGPPVAGAQIRIDRSVQPGDDSKSSDNRLGEIQAKGAGVFSHYLHLEEKSSESFTADGWFKTGDQGYMEHGNVRITGRISTMIVSEGGQNIQPEEVEDNFAKDPAIEEIAVLQKDRKLVALVVPKISGSVNDKDKIKQQIEASLREKGKSLPSYYQITDIALTREPLPRTNLGKLKRHLLEEIYDKSKKEKLATGTTSGGAMSPEEMSSDDQVLLDHPEARKCWQYLAEKFPDKQLTMDSSAQLDLGIDSLEWMNISLELQEIAGVALDEDAIAKVETVRDLIREVTEAGSTAAGGTEGGGAKPMSPLDEPDKFLSDEQKKWLAPLSPGMERCAKALYWTNRTLMHSIFDISAQGLENLTDSQYVFTPNHSSYLDAFALGAVLDYERLRHSHWAGFAGIAFNNPWNTFIYKLARAIPIEAKHALHASLAYGAAVLKGGKNLVWFPEGDRTRDGELLPFKAGIGMILNKYRVGVIPVCIKGTREALPPGAAWIKPGKIVVIFGTEVFAEDLLRAGQGKSDYEKIASGLQMRVQALKDGQQVINS